MQRGNRLLGKSVIAIALASLFSDLGHETATAVLPGFLTVVLAAPPIALGLVEGFSNLVAAGAKLYGGKLAADAIGLRGWAAGGYATTGLATALLGLVSSWPWLVLIRPIGWAGRGWRGPVRNLLLTLSVSKEQFGRAFGFERAGDNAGAVFAPLLAVVLLGVFSYRTTFLVAAIPGFLAAGCYLLVRRVRAERGNFRVRLAGYPTGFNRLLVAVAVFGSAQFAGSLFTLRAIQLLVPLHGRAAAVTLAIFLYFLYNLSATAVSYPVGAFADRTGRRQTALIAGFLSFAVAAALLALASSAVWMVIPAFVAGGFAAGSVEVAETALAAHQLAPIERGAGFGVLAAVNGAGDFVSSVWVALVWTLAAPAIAFAGAAILAIVGAVLAGRISISPERAINRDA
ncbi:MAG TPA: MFS transporter [Candidatus Dormibacteraeota bacterium]|nr:MFS transporter [Candidatus Dormibacteraeota bacterium]